jgi:septum formation protein
MIDPSPTLVLASKSPFRARLMSNAGLDFETGSADVDERAIEVPLVKAGLPPDDVAQVLAEAKALAVWDTGYWHPDALILGCDQTLDLGGKRLHKPADMEQARRQILDLSGKTHHLHSAMALVVGGETVWRHVSTAHLTMRPLTAEAVGRYCAKAEDAVLQSVGGYQIEGRGIQLFERIEGDYFTIVGLPLLPLLQELRNRGVIDG